MTIPESFELKAGAVEWLRVNLCDHPAIRGGARLTGTPTVTVTAGGPTLSNKQVDSTGRKIVFLATAGATAGTFTITALCATNETTPQTIGGDVGLRVF